MADAARYLLRDRSPLRPCALKKRPEETFYLSHGERQVLLCALGHLGKEGAEAIHVIISHCHHSKPVITDQMGAVKAMVMTGKPGEFFTWPG